MQLQNFDNGQITSNRLENNSQYGYHYNSSDSTGNSVAANTFTGNGLGSYCSSGSNCPLTAACQ